MDEMTDVFIDSTRVKTPMGNGLVVGQLHKTNRMIVNLDEKPVAAFEKGTNPLLTWSFDAKDVEVLKNETSYL